MGDDKFVFESLQDTETITAFLESLTSGVRKGRVRLSTNGDRIELEPEGLLNFVVKAKKKGGESKINIKISWKDGEPEPKEAPSPLKVD